MTPVPSPARIRSSCNGAVAIVEIDHEARRNALTDAMRLELALALEQAVDDVGVRCIVLRGRGDHFCAGADLSELEPRPAHEMRQRWAIVARITRAIAGPKPVVAAVRGAASGGGLALAAAADHIVAGADASFSAPFVRLGLVPDFGAMWSVPARIGRSRALELFARARSVAAPEALLWGLVNEVVAAADVESHALAVAQELASLPARALLSLRSSLRQGLSTLDACLEEECRLQTELVDTPDFKAALATLLARQRPRHS